MATKSGTTAATAMKFGGRKGAATPKKGSVADTNTKQMVMGTWSPRHLRRRGSN